MVDDLLKHTGETFAAAAFLEGLADLLEVALTHPERRSAIEVCRPQWMVCGWGVVAYDASTYGVTIEQLRSSTTITAHVSEKT